MNPEQDTILVNRDVDKFISGYAHLYSYDFNMMKILLKKCSLSNVYEKILKKKIWIKNLIRVYI